MPPGSSYDYREIMSLSDKDYRKYKNLVKLWERHFIKRENHAPSKEDIKLAPSDVKEAYKQYWLVKTSILEDEILDDEIGDTVPPAPEEKETNPEFEPTGISDKEINKDSVWGEHLQNSVEEKKNGDVRASSSSAFTEKLFKGVKLKINAKKFGFKKQKQKERPQTEVTPANTCEDDKSRDFPQIFAERESGSDAREHSPETIEEEPPAGFNLENVKILENQPKTPVHSTNILQNLLSSRGPTFKNKLNEGWLERCNQKCVEDTTTVQVNENDATSKANPPHANENCVPTDANVPSKPTKLKSKTGDCLNANLCSDDDYVYSSDDEMLTKLKSTSASMGQIISKPNANRKRSGEELPRASKKVKSLTKEEEIQERKLDKLEEKMKNGTINDNFVKIDLKHKRYARGKTTMTSTKYKIQQWKAKKKMNNSSRMNSSVSGVVLKCFRCGDVGHFMGSCKKKDALLPLEEGMEEDDSPFPTLEEAALMLKEEKNKDPITEIETILESSVAETDDYLDSVPPLYECQENGVPTVTPNEVFEALEEFGLQKFRKGQERAVMRILSGKSTLVISGTGSGKSLCYQLPAYLYSQKYKCISLVISPLVSLMEDQVVNFPPCLKAACLHTNQTAQVREKVLKKIENNEIAVLLVSPEAMVSGERGILGRTLIQNFPKIAFVCIDEVHCVSQWSHNFRTSYLMICKILRERYKIRTFLGLTATASKSSITCIQRHLGIGDDEAGVLQEDILPDNLILSASKDEFKDDALLALLKQPPFSEFDSIIIYCLRRNECERVARYLRISLENMRKKSSVLPGRSSISCDVEVYHAGVSAARRKRVQNHFMQGKLRIVVATVAFGMGINKSDIRGIIHFNMPPNFEHYVQEIGRAGRDGLLARCHLFYDHEGRDLPELKRHIHRDSLDRPTIRELLFKVFPRCSCEGTCRKHEIAFSVDDTVSQLDLPQENISTLLCYVELLLDRRIEVLPPTYTQCTITSYHGALALKRAARKCPPLAFAIAAYCQKQKTTTVSNKLDFSVIDLADRIGWDCGRVKRELKRCEWTQIDDRYRKTGIGVNFHDLGFHVRSPGNLTDDQLDDALNSLHERVTSQERTALRQLKMCDQAFSSVAYDTIDDMNEDEDLDTRDEKLKKIVRSYFTEENVPDCTESVEINVVEERSIANNVDRLVSSYRDQSFSALTVARIFHGIESPNFPALIWARTSYWRCALHVDFHAVYRTACRELVKFR